MKFRPCLFFKQQSGVLGLSSLAHNQLNFYFTGSNVRETSWTLSGKSGQYRWPLLKGETRECSTQPKVSFRNIFLWWCNFFAFFSRQITVFWNSQNSPINHQKKSIQTLFGLFWWFLWPFFKILLQIFSSNFNCKMRLFPEIFKHCE